MNIKASDLRFEVVILQLRGVEEDKLTGALDEMSGWSSMARNMGRRTAQNLLSCKPRVSATVKPSVPTSLKPVNRTPVAPASQGLGGRTMQSPLLSRSESVDVVDFKLT